MSPLTAWTEVRVVVPLGWRELVAEELATETGSSVVFDELEDENAERGALRAYLSKNQDDPAIRKSIEVRLDSLADRTGAAELKDLELQFRPLPPKDWASTWEKVWKPFRVGRLCVVGPTTQTELRPDDIRLELEPGGVFGSGRHATTRQCLLALQERIEPGARVLDVGTGTGILAVAAAQLGASSVLGFDLDRNSTPAARELAQANGVEAACEFRTGGFEVLGAEETGFDGCVANIYSDIVRELAPGLRARLRPGGWFIFSGCTRERRAVTEQDIVAAGLSVADVRMTGRWTTFVGRRAGRD